MKSFLKNVLANIVAIFIIGLIGFFLMIFIVIMSSMSQNSGVKVKKNSVLTLDLKTNIIDSPGEDQDDLFNFAEENKNIVLLDVIKAIQKAKTDDNIKGISIEADHINAGITQLDNIRTALEDFKKSGKFVLTYGNVVSQSSYYLGSVADQYYLNPVGGIELKGLSSEILFYKDFAEKYGVGVEVIRHGKYKSAVEPYLRNDMSPENKDQMSTILNDIWSQTASKISASRKISANDFKTVVDSLYGIIPDNTVKHKLVDKLLQKSEYDDILRKKLKIDQKYKISKVSFSKYINSFEEEDASDDKVGVLYASGAIYNGEGYDGVYSDNFIKDIKKVKEDESIKAVVLRINSPGGSANASDEILFELEQLKKKKPLVVSFGDYAASGGYYIAMAADKIYSEPNTLTGSIGVFGVVPYFKKLANNNGIYSEAVNTNANSNMYSPINGLTPGYITTLTQSVEQTYKRFVYFVTKNRKKSFEQIDKIGGGRVWSGTRGKSIGLVDELGSINDAVKFAGTKAKLKSYDVVSYPKKVSAFEQIFKDMNKEELSAKLIKNKIGEENYRIFQTLTKEKTEPSIMMESPFKINY